MQDDGESEEKYIERATAITRRSLDEKPLETEKRKGVPNAALVETMMNCHLRLQDLATMTCSKQSCELCTWCRPRENGCYQSCKVVDESHFFKHGKLKRDTFTNVHLQDTFT